MAQSLVKLLRPLSLGWTMKETAAMKAMTGLMTVASDRPMRKAAAMKASTGSHKALTSASA